MGSNGQIPYDDNSKPVLALWDDTTGQAIPLHVHSKVTGADGKTYATLDTGSGGPVTDLVASGTITAAQSTEGTPVANATVVLALGSGQATWEAQITGLGTGSTIAFDGVDDSGTSTNWQTAVGYQASIINPPPITSIAGPGPFIIRGTSSGYQQIRVRCTVYNGTDTIAVRLLGSVGSLAGAGGLVSNDGTFAKESGGNLATVVTNTGNSATVEGATTDAAVTGDASGTLSAKLRGLTKILGSVWDSVNNLLHINLKQVGGNAIAVGSNAVPVLNTAATGYVAAYGSNPAALTSNTDYQFKWGAGGTTQVNHIMIQNNSSITILWDLDVATNAGSPILTNVAPGNTLFLDVQTTVLHLQGAGTPNVNGSSAGNIVVRGWL